MSNNCRTFEEIYNQYFNHIYKYCCARTSVHDAEDVTAQVFTLAFANFEKVKRQNKPLTSWLYKIAHNCVIDFYRSQKKYLLVENIEENISQSVSDIAEQVVEKTKAQEIMKHFGKLSLIAQQVLFLKAEQELSFKEIAKEVGKSEAACRVITFRALKKLKSMISEEDFDEQQ